ncbi:MAG: TetR/AcrR family transcriptional regulator [Proteobacteria bacterium]|nr:TetR/AcrR family transcriptional regulator [Pseudomonadota bacterium]
MAKSGHESKVKLLNAATRVVRTKGYNAARVDDVCAEAGVTKGSFFHHFEGKEDLMLAAVTHWDEKSRAFFETAPFHAHADPLDRLLAYIDFRKSLIRGDLVDFTCFIGTMAQEVFDTHPAIREACRSSIASHAAAIEPDIEAAMRTHAFRGDWTAASLAMHIQAVNQGAFVLAKAEHGFDAAIMALEHLRRYVELLFERRADVASA